MSSSSVQTQSQRKIIKKQSERSVAYDGAHADGLNVVFHSEWYDWKNANWMFKKLQETKYFSCSFISTLIFSLLLEGNRLIKWKIIEISCLICDHHFSLGFYKPSMDSIPRNFNPQTWIQQDWKTSKFEGSRVTILCHKTSSGESDKFESWKKKEHPQLGKLCLFSKFQSILKLPVDCLCYHLSSNGSVLAQRSMDPKLCRCGFTFSQHLQFLPNPTR